MSMSLCGSNVRLVTRGLRLSLRVAPTLAGTACNVVYMFKWLWHMPMWNCSRLLTENETLSLKLLPNCLTLSLPATIPTALHAWLPPYMSSFPVGCSPLLMCSTGGLPIIRRRLDVPNLISRYTVVMNLGLVLGRLVRNALPIRRVPTSCRLGIVLLLELPALGITKLMTSSPPTPGRGSVVGVGRVTRPTVEGRTARAPLLHVVQLLGRRLNGALFGTNDGGLLLTRRTGLRHLNVGAILAMLLLNRRPRRLMVLPLGALGKVALQESLRRLVTSGALVGCAGVGRGLVIDRDVMVRGVVDRRTGRCRVSRRGLVVGRRLIVVPGTGLGMALELRCNVGTVLSDVKTPCKSLLLVRTVPLGD